MKLFIPVSLALVAIGTLPVAGADDLQSVVVSGVKPGTVVQNKTVSYADLDLSREPGIKRLLSRIQGAAGDVCSPPPRQNDIAGTKDYKDCINKAVSGAASKVNNPRLQELAVKAAQ